MDFQEDNLLEYTDYMPSHESPLQSEMLPGTLDMLVLQTLVLGPAHGHTIAHAIERGSDDVLQIEHGSLYPALHRLEDRGWIASFSVRVDYRDLRIQHLGQTSTEGLLELNPHVAAAPMREIRSTSGRKGTERSERIIGTTEQIPEGYETTGKTFQPGEIYLLTDRVNAPDPKNPATE